MGDSTTNAIRVNLDGWYSVNSLFSIPLGEEFLLHNLSTKPMQVSISDTQPTRGALNWLPLYTYKPYLPEAFDSQVWVYGDGFINVSDLTYDELDVVVANKGTGWVDPQTDSLTDDQLRASDVKVTLDDEVVNVAQSGTWDVSVNNLAPVVGTWGYSAGSLGTLTLTGGKRVLQITAVALEGAGSFTINGSDVITLPYGSTDKVSTEITIQPQGNLTDPVIVFTGTDSYFVEYVS
jgi:hypothetical protein